MNDETFRIWESMKTGFSTLGATLLAATPLWLTLYPAVAHAGPNVVTLPATLLTPTSVILNGTVNPDGLPTTVWFEWWENATDKVPSGPILVGNGTVAELIKSDELADLTTGVTYHFWVVAINKAGLGRGNNLRWQLSERCDMVTLHEFYCSARAEVQARLAAP